MSVTKVSVNVNLYVREITTFLDSSGIKYLVIKISDKKNERRFDRSTVIFEVKVHEVKIPHIYNF